ncbi:MAG: hypothetical protein LAO23_21855 [Acidobacteriia bacterium]|nr:hypothetical protein [Terriglobia bacterium]
MNFRPVLVVAGLLTAAVCGQVSAATPHEMLDLLAKCADMKDATERLACYDKLAPEMRETLAAVKKPSERTDEDKATLFGFDFGGVFSSREGPTTPEEFGKNQMPQAAEEGQALDSISAGVTDYAKTPFGKFIVFLDNGQVWRQLDSDAGTAHFLKEMKDNKLIISRGLLGSYNLKINDQNQVFKVKRLK